MTISQDDRPDAPVLARGILRIALADFAKQMTTMRAVNATGVAALEAKARFAELFAGLACAGLPGARSPRWRAERLTPAA